MSGGGKGKLLVELVWNQSRGRSDARRFFLHLSISFIATLSPPNRSNELTRACRQSRRASKADSSSDRESQRLSLRLKWD